jgi:hypothetical protein
MVTYTDWVVRYPQFSAVSEEVFNIFHADALIEMGTDETRWYNTYDVAQSALIAHFVAGYVSYETGDSTPLQPIRTKEVDDVMVEYAVSRDLRDNLDPYASTSYGQQYIKWRRQAFAGARVV